MPSRRSFLKTGALASAGLAVGTSRLTRAQSERDSAGGPSAPSNDAIRKQLFALGMGWGRRFFDPEIGLVRFEHPPSTHLSGGAAHLIRESAHIALGFLMLGDAATASRMLERVLSKQNVDENSRFFGGFTVEYEQDWVTWKDHDLNWAQFLGNVLGYIVEFDRSAHLLSPDLYGRVEQAFSRCVQGTLRRDVTQTYTNIALLSAAVAAQGDRLLRYPGSGEFATRKSRDVLQRIKIAGSFDEYLSPTYYGTNLDAVYALRQFSDGVRAATADELIELTWKDIEAAYHPATYQLGGPHSRAYGDNMLDYAASLKQYLFLALKGDYPLTPMEINHSHDNAFAIVRSQFEVGERPGLKWEKPRFRQG